MLKFIHNCFVVSDMLQTNFKIASLIIYEARVRFNKGTVLIVLMKIMYAVSLTSVEGVFILLREKVLSNF